LTRARNYDTAVFINQIRQGDLKEATKSMMEDERTEAFFMTWRRLDVWKQSGAGACVEHPCVVVCELFNSGAFKRLTARVRVDQTDSPDAKSTQGAT
jgi:hypothetical protein